MYKQRFVAFTLASLSTLAMIGHKPAFAQSQNQPSGLDFNNIMDIVKNFGTRLGTEFVSCLAEHIANQNEATDNSGSLKSCVKNAIGGVFPSGDSTSVVSAFFGGGQNSPLTFASSQKARQLLQQANRTGINKRTQDEIAGSIAEQLRVQVGKVGNIKRSVNKSGEALQRISERVQGLQGTEGKNGQQGEPSMEESVKTNVSTLEKLANQAESIANQSYVSSQEILKQILTVASLHTQQNVAFGEIAQSIHKQAQTSNETLKDMAEILTEQNKILQASSENNADFYMRLLEQQAQQHMALQQILGKIPDFSQPVQQAVPAAAITALGKNPCNSTNNLRGCNTGVKISKPANR